MSDSSESVSWSYPAVLGGALLATFLVAFAWSAENAAVFQSTLGLIALPALLFGLGVGVCVPLLHNTAPSDELRRFVGQTSLRARWAMAGPVYLVVWFLSGFLALRLFAAFEGRAVGASLLGMSAVGLFTAGSLVIRRASRWLMSRGWEPGMGQAIGLGFVLPIVGAVALIVFGSTSGAGSPWALFGVLRREELDLTIVAQCVTLGAAAYLGALFLGRSRRSLGVVLVLSSVLVSFYFVRVAARSELRALLPAERSSDLQSFALRQLRRVSDKDGDGFSALFAGGDCKEGDGSVFPGAQDIPGNGVDEDCSGRDAAESDLAAAHDGKNSAPEEEPEVRVPPAANFLLLTIDTLRADLGYTRADGSPDITPHLDRLAARSTVFENAYALASYTSKSLPPMLLGRYASETDRSFEHFDRFGTTVPFVQEVLQESGVKTVSVQGYWYFFFKSYGLERGWDVLDSEAAPRRVVVDGDRTSNGDLLADQSIEQLAALATSKERFFMWTHWVDPHAEYVPHEEFDYGSSPQERYDGEVSFVDAQIGRVLAALQEHSLDDSTVILVSSDHGEAFSEHGMIRHGFEVWEELVRVPLILHVPGAPPRRIAERRSLIDLVPTILQTFELEVPREGAGFVRGESLLTDALQKDSVAPDQREVLVDMPQGPHNQERRAFYSGDYKLVTSRGRTLGLYNLKLDPGETKDLSSDEAQLAPIKEEMGAYLDTLRQIPPRR